MAGSLRRMFGYARRYRGALLVATAIGIAKFNLPVAFPWILKEVVDRVLVGTPSSLGLGLDGLVLLGFGLSLLHAGITYLRTWTADRLGQRLVYDLRSDLFAHLQCLPLDYFLRQRTGAIAARLISDVALAQNLVSLLATNVFMELSVVGAITAVVFNLNAQLALIAYATLPLYVFLHRALVVRMREGAREARRRMDDVEAELHETITAIADIKSFAHEPQRRQSFAARCRAHLEVAQRNVHTFGLSLATTALFTRVPTLLVLWVGAGKVQAGALSVGGLMAFWAYLEMVFNPLTRLADLSVQIANSRAALDRIFELFDTAPEASPQSTPPLAVREGRVQYRGVRFGYGEGREVLVGVDCELAPGERVALVGPSGAGKSTMAKLLLGLHRPRAGSVAIDGQDLAAVDLASLRRQVAVVAQDAVLLHGTVEDNLRLGKPDASAAELAQALQLANAHEFVAALPGGLSAMVGERGATLSGGQRQRLAIARAFLVDAPILVLDEATTHLDPLAEQAVEDALGRLCRGRTTLVIAHRLSTVVTADRLLVLEAGRVVESGRHDDLLQRGGTYTRLYRDRHLELR